MVNEFSYKDVDYIIFKGAQKAYFDLKRRDEEKIKDKTFVLRNLLIIKGYDRNEVKNIVGGNNLAGLAIKVLNGTPIKVKKADPNTPNEELPERTTKQNSSNGGDKIVDIINKGPSNMTPVQFYDYCKNYLEEYASNNNIDLDQYMEMTDYNPNWTYIHDYNLNMDNQTNKLAYTFAQFAYHATNSSNSPFYGFREIVQERKELMCNFNVNDFVNKYTNMDFDEALEEFKHVLLKNNEYKLDSINKTRKYLKLMINVALYLQNRGTREAVIKEIVNHISKENPSKGVDYVINTIFKYHYNDESLNVGFALTLDSIKELSEDLNYLFKPDLHVIDLLGCYYGKKATAKETLKIAIKLVDVISKERTDVTGYTFDRMLYLIGSGNFYIDGLRVPNHVYCKKEFMKGMLNL